MSLEDEKILFQWLEKASNDLIAASILIESGATILDIACFIVSKRLKSI